MLEAGTTRLRPVIMTALAMIIGMVPMSLGLGEGGEQNAPLGRAVIGGLLVATIATLFFVPAVYSIIRGRDERKADQRGRRATTIRATTRNSRRTSRPTRRTRINTMATITTATAAPPPPASPRHRAAAPPVQPARARRSSRRSAAAICSGSGSFIFLVVLGCIVAFVMVTQEPRSQASSTRHTQQMAAPTVLVVKPEPGSGEVHLVLPGTVQA